jgi:DNA mismatch repair protein MutS
MSLIDNYFKLTENYRQKYGDKTLLLMQVGAFFEVYGKKHKLFENQLKGSKIDEFCNICELNKSTKAKVSVNHTFQDEIIKCNVVMAGFRDYVLDKYLEKLTDSGYTIVVHAQEADNPTKRYELGIFTPGTQIKEDVHVINNVILCIFLYHQKPSKLLKNQKNIIHYGISTIDVLTGSTSICEYSEQYYNSLTTYDELERQYSIYNPNETIICYNEENIPSNIIQGLINYIGIHSTLIRQINISLDQPLSKQAENCGKQKYQSTILQKFYNNDYEQIQEMIYEYQCGIQSFCFLLDYTSTYNQNLTNKIRVPIMNKNNQTLTLANHSLKQLNIIPLYKSEHKLSSVLDFINECNTSMGKRHVKQLLVNPITNVELLEKSYIITNYCIEQFEIFSPMKKQLKSIIDIEKFYRRLANNQINPCDISSFYNSIQIIKDIFNIVKDNDFLKQHKLFDTKSLQQSQKQLFTIIKNTFHIKKINNLQNDYYSQNIFIKGFSQHIDSIEEEYFESFDNITQIIDIFDTMIKKTEKKCKSGNYCKLHETDKSGYMIKITDTRGKKLMNEIKNHRNINNSDVLKYSYVSSYDKDEYESEINIQHLKTIKRGNDTLITSPDIEHLLDSIYKCKNNMKREVEKEFKIFCKTLLEYKDDFENIIDFVVNMDVMICKAQIAKKYNFCRPTIDNTQKTSFIEAKQMRHVLIEHINQEELYVPNDISLNKDETGILLFGTNAVGKSSLIKSIGICVIMAQSGFYVPCSSFVYKPFTRIFTRILGNDNIFKGLSTFAVEMSELRTILKYSDENSLVLGDELCSGTELGSAISIFLAGLKHLYERKSKFIFATHFHEITNMKELKSLTSVCMKHMSVHYDAKIDGLVYDRIIRNGPGNNMYGLEVCKALNLPKDFIDLAYEIRNKSNPREKTISSQKGSKYNAKKIKGNCEMCGNEGVEVHHLQHQKNANEEGFINTFHKNHIANLMNICEECHDTIHAQNIQHKRVKTTKGIVIMEK